MDKYRVRYWYLGTIKEDYVDKDVLEKMIQDRYEFEEIILWTKN